MRVLGIDPGTATTGWGVVEFRDGKISCIDFGCIRTHAKEAKAERLRIIYRSLLRIIRRFRPEDMAIEKLFFNANVKTAMSVSQCRGVCLLASAVTGLNTYEYNSSAVKRAVAGHGKATKREVAMRVREILRLNDIPKPDDASDALAVAIAHILRTYRSPTASLNKNNKNKRKSQQKHEEKIKHSAAK